MNKQTILAEMIDTADDRAKYDASTNNLSFSKLFVQKNAPHSST